MGHLQQDAGAVAGFGVAAGGAAVAQVDQHLKPFLDDAVGLAALDVGDYADAAVVVFLLGGIEALGGQFFQWVHILNDTFLSLTMLYDALPGKAAL